MPVLSIGLHLECGSGQAWRGRKEMLNDGVSHYHPNCNRCIFTIPKRGAQVIKIDTNGPTVSSNVGWTTKCGSLALSTYGVCWVTDRISDYLCDTLIIRFDGTVRGQIITYFLVYPESRRATSDDGDCRYDHTSTFHDGGNILISSGVRTARLHSVNSPSGGV